MKFFSRAVLSGLAFSVFAGTVFAQENAAAGTPPQECGNHCLAAADDVDDAPPAPPSFSREEAEILRSLFLLSDAQLHRLGMFIRHLERMPPESRRQMAEDLERASAAQTPEQRKAHVKEMRERFRKNQENLLSRYYATLSPEQADAERKKFLELDRKGRRDYIAGVREKLGLEPFPPHPPRRPEHGFHRHAPPPPPPAQEEEKAAPLAD